MSGKRKGPRKWFRKKQQGGTHKALAAMIAVLGLIVLSFGFVGAPAQAAPGGGDVCTGLDSGKIDTSGDPLSVTVTAPDGMLIDQYCVKAGSSNQGDGPVYVDVNPPVKTLTFGYPGGKAVSHYSLSYVPVTHDECPDLEGDQPEGTDCTQPPDDRETRDLPGVVNCETDTYTVEHQERTREYSWDGDSWEPGPWSDWTTFDTTVTEATDEQCPPPPNECPEGKEWVDYNENGEIDEGECEELPTVVPVPTQDTLDPCNPQGVSNNVTWKDPLPADTDTVDWSESNNGATRTATLKGDTEWSDGTTAPKVFNLPADSGEECETPPELVVTVIPNQGSCEVRTPEAQVTTNFASSIAYQVEGEERVFAHREVQAGTYTVTLPDVAEGSSVSYEIVVVPLDDSAEPIVKGPFTFSVPEDCDEVPPCTEFQDENPEAPCYVERKPEERVEIGTRESCRLGGVETTTAVFTTTYSFNEETQAWESSETATSSVAFTPYTKAQLKEKGCINPPPPNNPDQPVNPTFDTGLSGQPQGERSVPFGLIGLMLIGLAAGMLLIGSPVPARVRRR